MFRNYIVLGIVYVDKASIRLLYCKVFPHRKKGGKSFFLLNETREKFIPRFGEEITKTKKKLWVFENFPIGTWEGKLFDCLNCLFLLRKKFFFQILFIHVRVHHHHSFFHLDYGKKKFLSKCAGNLQTK